MILQCRKEKHEKEQRCNDAAREEFEIEATLNYIKRTINMACEKENLNRNEMR